MGEPMIGPAFRAEIATFLVVTGTSGRTLGRLALENPDFVRKPNSGDSPRLDAVQKVRAWMRRTASLRERVEIARAVADPGVPDPVLNPVPGAVNELADLGLADAHAHFAKAELVSRMDDIVRERGITQAEAARLLGVSEPNLSRLLRGDFREYSLERLLRLLTTLH